MFTPLLTFSLAAAAAVPLAADRLALLPAELADRHPQQGSIALGDGLAVLDLPSDAVFLGPEDAAAFLTETWHNPPRALPPLGLIAPLSDGADGAVAWAVVVTADDSGHVSDSEAGELDAGPMLARMQRHAEADDAASQAGGYSRVRILRWLVAPRYDAARRALVWAPELATLNDDDDAEKNRFLNYRVMLLGRETMVSLLAVADPDAIDAVGKMMDATAARVSFVPGERYEDFDASTGRHAAVGLVGLVAGTAAAKAGLFKGLLVALLALKKVVFVAVAAGVTALVRLARRLLGRAPPAAALPPGPEKTSG